LRLVEHAIREGKRANGDVVALINHAVRQFHDKNMIYTHYSRERLATSEAKAFWLEPDLGAFAFETARDESR
jgi:hypothetical protein